MLDPAWFEAIDRRISRRRFTGEMPTDQALSALRHFCETFRAPDIGPDSAARAVLIERAPSDLFTGLVGSYGRIEGAPSAALVVGRPGSDVWVGYVGEALVLEATRLGVDTCWLAGAFSRKRATSLAELSPGEHVPAIVAIGIAESGMGAGEKTMRAFVRASTRLSAEKIANGSDVDSWPDWAQSAIEAARKAPSGGNSQPWRFRMDSGALVVSQGGRAYWTAEMDFGIAMLHAELGAAHADVSGRWELLEKPDVARFVPS